MRAFPLLTLVALAACSPGAQDDAAPDADNALIVNDASAIPVAPDNATPADVGNGAGAAQPASQGKGIGTVIPPALRGRWGMSGKDCTSLHGDAKGLLEISGETVLFFESRGTLKRIREQEPTRIRADFAFEGEGASWENSMTLTVQDDGQTLIRQDHQTDDGAPALYHYSRCSPPS